MPWSKLLAAATISIGVGILLAWWDAAGTGVSSAASILAFVGVLLVGVPAVAALVVARPGYRLARSIPAGAASVVIAMVTWVGVAQPDTDMGYWAYGLLAAWLLVGVVVGGAVGAIVCGVTGALSTGDVDVSEENRSA